MKRFALACAVLAALFLLPLLSLSEATEVILSDTNGLLSHQDRLDEIQENITYVETVGYSPKQMDFARVLSQIEAMVEGQPGQIYHAADRITLSGGVHYIADECDLENVTLLNNAVLFNFSGTIRTLSIKDEAKYFGAGNSQALNIIMERNSAAYLQDAKGDRLTAAGNSEALLFDASNFPISYALENATIAVFGNSAEIARGYVGKNADLFDPNGRVLDVEWEEGRGEAASGTGSGKKPAQKEEEAPYPPNIMEWVFGSKPQGGAVWASDTCVGTGCKCSNADNPHSCTPTPCCSACICIRIYDAEPCEEVFPR